MGVYLHENFSGLSNVKKTVIDLGTKLTLLQPREDVTYENIDFSTRTQTESFDKDIDLTHINGEATLNFGLKGFGLESRCSGIREKEKENKKISQTHKFNQKRGKCAFVPIAAIELTLSDVHLIQEAVNDLLEIEVLMIPGAECSSLVVRCLEFFNTYGSHINIGLLHFGGIYKWTATYTSEEDTKTESVKNLLQTTLEGFISLGVASCTKQFGIGVSGSYLSNHSDIGKKYSHTELSRVELQIEKTGGPPEVEDYHEWKDGLACASSTWALISSQHFVGIWQILQNNSTQFKDVKRLGLCLENVWKVTNLEYDETNSKNCIQCIKALSETIEILITLTGDQKFLKHFIQEDDKMQTFFNFIATSKYMAETRKYLVVLEMWHFLVQNLKDAHIPHRSTLTAWIAKEYDKITDFLSKKDSPSVLTTEKIDTVHTFFVVLKTKFLPQMRTAKCQENQNSFLTKEQYITSEIAHVCHCLLEKLKVSDIEHFVILLSALSKFRYDETVGFSHLLKLSDVEDFVNEFEPPYNEYIQCSQKSSCMQKQALLVDIITTNIIRYRNQHSEKYFDYCYLNIKSKIDDIITSKLEFHMKSSFYDWKQIKSDLKSLIRDEALPTKISMQLKVSYTDEKTSLLSSKCCDFYTAEFITYLRDMNVIDCFPEKLQYREAISISSRSSENPFWFLLEQILLQNSSIFIALENYVTSIGSSTDNHERTSNENVSDDTIDFDFLNCLPMESKEIATFNPLDLIVSIFACSTQFLKQTLASKLHEARLAIPILLPVVASESLCFSLGVLRSISIPQRGSLIPGLDCPVNVLSFMRLGRPQHSKSEMINNFLNSENHHTFFNQNAPLGRTDRRISNGLVETTFVLPNEKENLTLIFNTRGDSGIYSKQQMSLCAISTAIIVLVTTEKLLEYVTLFSLIKEQENTIIVIALDASLKTKEEVRRATENFIQRLSNRRQIKFVILQMKGVPERRSIDINKDLQKCLLAIHEITPLKTLQQLACNQTCIPVDDDCEFQSEKSCAEEAMNLISKDSFVEKKDILPLQSDLLYKLSKNMKQMFKPMEYKTEVRKHEIMFECNEIRRMQRELFPTIHPFMKFFIESMLSRLESESKLLMISVWLKSLLEIMSKTKIPFSEVELELDAPKRTNIIGSKHDEYKIHEMTFGFEHLLREMGQMYEASTDQIDSIEPTTSDFVKTFPIVPAKLLVAGLPFQIMNGELVHVPVVWVKAVFDALKTLTGDSKCLILSIIGTQSSGKSTLLNTMFGIQFPVGHGRVTKGAFVQLIKMNQTQMKTSYDYILVIDTEGLRAPELGDKNCFRDNEFATFIIGLADINIVNIKGEFSTEMNEVLHMVVYALLRLQIANAGLGRKQSCVFLHQNVNVTGDDNSLCKTMQKITETLNLMTKDAAEHLNIADIEEFADVIDFNPETSVWYLPDLLTGKQPMMRVNPSYSSKVEYIRNVILFKISSKERQYLTISDITSRIHDIWNGILMEDFTFNFRNSVEVQAFALMERNFNELIWDSEFFITDYIFAKKYELAKCNHEKDINDVIEKVKDTISGMLHEKYEIIEATFESFINSHKFQNTMNKYKQNFGIRMQASLRTLINESKRNLDIMKDEIRQSRMCKKATKECEDEINRLASEFAEQIRKTDINESSISDKFNECWISWTAKFLKGNRSDEKPLLQSIVELIRERYTSEQRFMTTIESLQNKKDTNVFFLYNTLTTQDIKNTVHISIDKKITGYIPDEKPQTCKNQTIEFTNKLFNEIDNFILKLHLEDTRFHDIHMKKILEKVDNKVRIFNENKNKAFRFRLLPGYKALILKRITLYCVQEFTKLNEKYEDKNSPQRQLDKYRDTAWKLFNDLLNNKKEDLIAADFFIKAIDESVRKTLADKLPRLIENEILQRFQHSKYQLMKTVMKDLVKQKKYSSFEKYINDSSTFIEQWLVYHTNHILFQKEKNTKQRLYDRLCRANISEIFAEVNKSINTVTTELERTRNKGFGSLISEWIKRFVRIIPTLSVSADDLAHVSKRHVTNIQIYHHSVLSQLSDIEKSILTTVYTTEETSVQWKSCPYTKVFEKLWGCCESCPFCNEPCDQTDKDHSTKHKCRQHRPQGLGDVALDGGNGPLVTDVCNFLIRTDKTFITDDGKEECMYKKYMTIFDKWEISPSFVSSKYWYWFFKTYKHEIANTYGAKLPCIPEYWKSITEEEAIKEL